MGVKRFKTTLAIDGIHTGGILMINITLNVQGMTCGHCEKAVQTAIKVLDPQAQVTIDRAQNKVEVTSTQSREAIAAAIEDEGYTVAA